MMKQNLKQEKEQAELKWLKVQRNIAILGLIASILATSLQYLDKFYKYISKASVKIILEDDHLAKYETIKIVSVAKANNTIITGHPNEIPKPISLDEGSYLIELMRIDGIILFKDDFYLKAKEKKIIKIPSSSRGGIFVYVILGTERVFPEMPLPLKVISSERGYLWIYEIKEGNSFPKTLFPVNHRENEISPDNEFILPNSNITGIKSGSQVGKEKIIFIVTEKQEKDFANRIAQNIQKGSIQKAGIIESGMKYGLFSLSYNIDKF